MVIFRYIITPIIGALLGWLIAEPWTDSYGFFRDWMLFFLLALGIILGVVLNQAIFNKKFGLIPPILKNSKLYIIPLVGSLIIKLLLSSWGGEEACSLDIQVDNTILVLDVSSSMDGRPMRELKRAISEYLDLLSCSESKDMVSCVTFASTASVYFGASSDYNLLKSKIENLDSGGGTNMATGLQLAFSEFKLSNQENYSIIVVADGKTDNSQVQRFINGHNNIPIHTIGAGSSYDKDLLQFISSKTSGNYYEANNVSELAEVFKKVATRQGLTNVSTGDQLSQISPLLRTLGWILLGLIIGFTIGTIDQRKEMVIIGLLGGFLGGGVSSLVFYLLDQMITESGSMLRLITFTIFGAFLGLSIYFVQFLYTKLRKRNSRGEQSFSEQLDNL